jgi:hypothetical protein
VNDTKPTISTSRLIVWFLLINLALLLMLKGNIYLAFGTVLFMGANCFCLNPPSEWTRRRTISWSWPGFKLIGLGALILTLVIWAGSQLANHLKWAEADQGRIYFIGFIWIVYVFLGIRLWRQRRGSVAAVPSPTG